MPPAIKYSLSDAAGENHTARKVVALYGDARIGDRYIEIDPLLIHGFLRGCSGFLKRVSACVIVGVRAVHVHSLYCKDKIY